MAVVIDHHPLTLKPGDEPGVVHVYVDDKASPAEVRDGVAQLEVDYSVDWDEGPLDDSAGKLYYTAQERPPF